MSPHRAFEDGRGRLTFLAFRRLRTVALGTMRDLRHDRNEPLPHVVDHIQVHVVSLRVPPHLLIEGFAGCWNPCGKYERVPRK